MLLTLRSWKKASRQVELPCYYKKTTWSRYTPRYFTQVWKGVSIPTMAVKLLSKNSGWANINFSPYIWSLLVVVQAWLSVLQFSCQLSGNVWTIQCDQCIYERSSHKHLHLSDGLNVKCEEHWDDNVALCNSHGSCDMERTECHPHQSAHDHAKSKAKREFYHQKQLLHWVCGWICHSVMRSEFIFAVVMVLCPKIAETLINHRDNGSCLVDDGSRV